MSREIYDAVVPMPGFALGVHCRGDVVTGIEFLSERPPVAATSAFAAEVARQLTAYGADPDHRFDLPVAPAGTEFRRRVWAAIAAIPRGKTRTYGELARELGSSPRAVGQACGDNPYPLVVPCHRVVASGGPGGFAHARDGLLPDIKRWLLRHEA
ncbi:MAG: methylated-DNA--[protein]-cysteine S-methyltransferase [Rhodocyclaceae bacterium]|nr:methylated-DNA--[protein]-cysteine S-methyltransferase [Rhodocyclaceae bacterium]